MSGFLDRFDNRLDILSLDVSDLAGLLLEYFHSVEFTQRRHVMCTSNIRSEHMVPPGERRHDVSRAIIEAWQWLINAGLVVPYPLDPHSDQYEFSRRGALLTDQQQFSAFRERLRCPRELIHERLIESAWPIFLRGDFDTAVFQSFKEVEVAVRDAGGYSDTDFGKELMRKAFRPANESGVGPLTDGSEPSEEQKSLQELFAGAYGRARNPTAHRHGVLSDSTEAFEMMVMAGHLLRIVDRRIGSSPDSDSGGTH